jgi:mono/diheme cytochrome c family protein
MQVKVIIGTIAFMLSMIILGLITLFEPARMDQFSAAEIGRNIESGANIYFENCVECHGINGKAEECYDASGEQIGCKGRALNSAALLCGEPSQRLNDMQWTGSKYAFIHSTLTAGRTANGMPVWAQENGGPLQYNDINNLTLFILNYHTEALCEVQPFTFPWPGSMLSAEYPDPFVEAYNTYLGLTMDDITLEEGQTVEFELPVTAPGDAERGAQLFDTTYGCQACHGNPQTGDPAASIGPSLSDIAVTGNERMPGYNASQYVYESILNPAAFLAPECPNGECANAMSNNFGERMSGSPQDMVDIMTYLLGVDLDTQAIPSGE